MLPCLVLTLQRLYGRNYKVHIPVATLKHMLVNASEAHLPEGVLLHLNVIARERQELLHTQHITSAGICKCFHHRLRILRYAIAERLCDLQAS
jgi:hypothetical protein